jgi:hypothetical protein
MEFVGSTRMWTSDWVVASPSNEMGQKMDVERMAGGLAGGLGWLVGAGHCGLKDAGRKLVGGVHGPPTWLG